MVLSMSTLSVFSLCERKNEQQNEDMALPVVWGLGIGVPHDWDTAGLKPSARTTKPRTQRVPGGLIQATKVAFVREAEGFSPAALG
jgi:hypothetical protein